MAYCVVVPHISREGVSRLQIGGRVSWPKRRHLPSSVNWIQRTPAALPPGIPGMGDEMEMTIQQAAQPTRQITILPIV